MAKDVLNRRALSYEQEWILNSVLNPNSTKGIKSNSINIFYITAILICIAVIKYCIAR